MASSWLLRFVLSVFLAIIAGYYVHVYRGEINKQESISEANLGKEHFFRDDYVAARALFLLSAKEADAELLFLPVINQLGTDVAVLRGVGTPEKFLIHLSGIHGVEGYAGSAVQSLALQYISQYRQIVIKEENDENSEKQFPTIVFVHAVNPFGFANNRRVNEDNIDLNRNFLTEDEFATVMARDPNYAGYVDLDSLINPVKQISSISLLNDIYNAFQTVYAVSRYGMMHMKRALVSGNYHKENGVGFGGKSQSQSAKNLIKLVQDEWMGMSRAEEVILIDVHTGLGPSGVDTLDSSNSLEEFNQAFPTEFDFGAPSLHKEEAIADSGKNGNGKPGVITGGIHQKPIGEGTAAASEALSGYDLTVGMTTTGFCKNFLAQSLPRDKVTCIIQEFGTVNLITVGKNMISENYAHFHGSELEKLLYRKRYRDCFYVQTNTWKQNVARRGLMVILQAIHKLGVTQKDLPLPTDNML